MERLNRQACMTYWKVSAIYLASIFVISWTSKKCFEQSKLPRHHLLKLTDILRKALEHSISASQDTCPQTKYRDTCKAQIYAGLVNDLLTPEQIRDLSGIEINELVHVLNSATF